MHVLKHTQDKFTVPMIVYNNAPINAVTCQPHVT